MAIKKCPICGQLTTRAQAAYPFCSSRCQLIDLGNWSSENYAVPGEPADPQPDNELGQRPITDLIQ